MAEANCFVLGVIGKRFNHHAVSGFRNKHDYWAGHCDPIFQYRAISPTAPTHAGLQMCQLNIHVRPRLFSVWMLLLCLPSRFLPAGIFAIPAANEGTQGPLITEPFLSLL